MILITQPFGCPIPQEDLHVVLELAWALELTPQGVRKAGGRDMPIYVVATVLALITLYWYFGNKPELASGDSGTTVQLPDDQGANDSNSGPPSIAVIPFENLSMDDANEPFTLGIHGDLLTQLLKIGSLKTISRTSVMRYRRSEMSIPEIADELACILHK